MELSHTDSYILSVLALALSVCVDIHSVGKHGNYPFWHVATHNYIPGVAAASHTIPNQREVHSLSVGYDLWQSAGRYSNPSGQLQLPHLFCVSAYKVICTR